MIGTLRGKPPDAAPKEEGQMGRKIESKTVLRALVPYPAVFVPNRFGGFDVFFPNFPKAETSGLNWALSQKAAREKLTRELYQAFRDGEDPPGPSDPEELFWDQEEIPGTRILMIESDKDWIMKGLGLGKKRMRTAPTGEKFVP